AITTSEPGGNGASACGARVTTALTSASHSVINAANVVSDMALGGPRLAPATVTRVSLGGRTYTPVNAADTWALTIPAADLAALADNTDHALVVSFSDGSPDATRMIRKDVTAPVVSATVEPGSYPTAQRVALRADGGEQVRYTLNGSASRAYDGEPVVLGIGNQTIRASATDAAGNTGAATFAYAIAPALAPPAVSAVSPGAVVPTAPSLAVKSLSVPKRLRARAVRRNGVRLTMRLAAGTRALELRIYRKASNRRRLVTRVVRSPRRAGAYAVNLGRSLKPGLYTVIATAGTSEDALDSAHSAAAMFRVIR
ncbi:MAG TPA: chitobiase/beta-hexosaminidase C-terminal domain-containing protein, partial [Solirubrobacteraceae bacterium]